MTQVIRRGRSKPVITKELIEWLESIYPNNILRHATSSVAEWNQALGEQKVIEKLRMEFRSQNGLDEAEED